MIPYIQLAIFTTYIIFIVSKFGVLPSISDSWYSLGKKAPLFTLFIWGISIPMAVMGGLHNNVWYFLAGSLLCFTGGAAAFKESMAGTIHSIGAVGGITLALVGLASVGVYWPLIAVISLSLGIRYSKINNQTWWVEIISFVFIEAGLL